MKRILPQKRTIKFRLLSITIFLLFSSILLVSSLSYSQYTQDFHKQSVQNILQITEQVSYNIETYLDEIFRLVEAPYYNDRLMNLLSSSIPATELEKLEKRREIEDYLNEMMITPRQDIISAFLISDEIYHGGRYSVSTDDSACPAEYFWYQEALSTNHAVFVPAHTEQLIKNPRFKVFSFVKRLNKISNPAISVGVIKIDANYNGIEKVMEKVDLGPGGSIFIIDQNQNIVFNGNSQMDPLQFYKISQSREEQALTVTLDGKEWLLTFADIPLADWTVLTVNAVKDLNWEALQTRNFTFLIAFACAIFSSIILLLFCNSFLNPLMKIISLMKEVRQGNLQVSFPETRTDEIGELGSTFNQMLGKINRMVKEVYEARLLQNEAQMNAFYSQIRPHFLFNTLNMISMMIQTSKYDMAVTNIDRLSDLLRQMAHLNQEIPLKQELDLLEDYLSIQSNRYRNRLYYVFAIDPSLYPYKIPALIFQPIVENTIIHGCEKKKEPTHILIDSICEQDFLLFRIQDDAGGIPETKLNEIRRMLESPYATSFSASHSNGRKASIGLVNVHQRIQIKFGNSYGLSISSSYGSGTSVFIKLPPYNGKELK